MTRTFLAAVLALMLSASPAAAQLQPEDAGLVPLFLQTCISPEMNADATLAAIAGSADWVETTPTTVDVTQLDQVPSTQMSGAYRRPETVREWHRSVNGRTLTLVVASLPERNRYRHVCALFAPDIRNAMPYLEAMDEGMRTVGLSGRSTDLPHFREYGGRLSGNRRAHADIFSRSRATSAQRSMHLVIAYE
jgi:hypothetical protein